jgi:DNA-binding LacI/PurR family transcriptional regulator
MPERRARQPVHLTIAAELEAEVRRGLRPGDRLPPETALAKRFDVSTLTIREAVGCLVQKNLVVRRRGSGTYVTDPRESQHVAVLVNLDIQAQESAGFWLPLAQSLQQMIEACGYRTRLYAGHVEDNSERKPDEITCAAFAEDLEKQLLLGVVVLGNRMPLAQEKRIAKLGLPHVGSRRGPEYNVYNDYPKMVLAALRRLAADGRKRVGTLLWGVSHEVASTLYAEAGLPCDDALLVPTDHPALPGAGYGAVKRLLATCVPPPDGLLITDEFLLPGASMALLAAGIRVPDELALVVYANEGASVFSPLPLTAMVISPRRNAELLGGVLVRLLQGDPVPPQRIEAHFNWEERPFGSPDRWHYHVSTDAASAAPVR